MVRKHYITSVTTVIVTSSIVTVLITSSITVIITIVTIITVITVVTIITIITITITPALAPLPSHSCLSWLSYRATSCLILSGLALSRGDEGKGKLVDILSAEYDVSRHSGTAIGTYTPVCLFETSLLPAVLCRAV